MNHCNCSFTSVIAPPEAVSAALLCPEALRVSDAAASLVAGDVATVVEFVAVSLLPQAASTSSPAAAVAAPIFFPIRDICSPS